MTNMEYYYNQRNQHTNPPGTYIEILSTPLSQDEAIEVAILNEHRFAFYYWLKWTNNLISKKKINNPPSLITIDWHNDLAKLSGVEKKFLDNLNQTNLEEVSFFAWSKLN